MATYTTNLDLKKPAQSDKIRIADINGNMDEIDAAFGAVGETSVATQLGDIRGGMAIVSNGDTHDAIAAGQFVYVMNHSTLDDGLYTADSALAANASLTSSNVTAVSGGGLNALNSNLTTLSGQLSSKANMVKTSLSGGASATGIQYPCFIVGGRQAAYADAYCAFVDVVGAIQVIKSSSIFTVSVEQSGVKITNNSGVTASFIVIN